MSDYLDKDKVYQFEIILGITTASTDFMGDPSYHFNIDYDFDNIKQKIIDYMDKINGTEFEQKYHCYSSKRVNGEPLWKITKQLGVYPPRFHKVTLYNYKHIEDKEYDYKLWREKNINIVKNVKGDFSQEFICDFWNLRDKDRNNNTIEKINSIKFEIKTSSGFYVRQLVKDISRHIKLDLLTFDINRINILL
jgi:tRNA U55 pseudouridine synthase TruB